MKANELQTLLETQDRFDLELICPDMLQRLLQELGTDFEEDWDTNGWEVDFWIYFFFNNIRYCFEGSWYYGNYKIYKDEE